MKRFLLILVVLIVAAGAFLYFGGAERLGIELPFGPPQTAAAPDTQGQDDSAEVPLPPVLASTDVIADAKVVPVQYADLSMPTSGIVDEVLVAEGGQVQAGDVIVRLQNVRQQAAVEQARAALFRAQAQMAELEAGARIEEIEAAQASVDAAKARLSQLSDPARPEEIKAAEAEVTSAQAALNALYRDPSDTAQREAKADLNAAEAKLRQARSDYNEVAWRSDIGKLPQSFALEEATTAFEAAQARFDSLFNSPDADAVAAAQARIQQAQADLDRLTTPATDAQIAEAEAEVRRNQANLDQLLAGARAEEIARVGADIADAKARLMQAESDLADTELRAPFAGTLAFLDVKNGEQVNAGTVIAQVADLTQWQIETSDLTEINIVNVAEGDPVTLTFDAINDLEIGGTVERIRPVGENQQGDIVYTVIVKPDTQDARLRWNMTAVTRIGQE